MNTNLKRLRCFTPTSSNSTSKKDESVQHSWRASESFKYPSFSRMKPASIKSSNSKKNNSHSNTKHEAKLRSELHRMGLRFRKNVRSLPGKPDIVFTKARVVVFCDGDFWHGRDWKILRQKLAKGYNSSYWLAKIEANRERDHHVTEELLGQDWEVIRIWETDILSDVEGVAKLVATLVFNRLSSINKK